MKDSHILIFDIDETLTDDISWLKITEMLGANVEIHKQIFEDFKNNRIEYSIAKRDLIHLWNKTGNASREKMEELFYSIKLKQEASQIIQNLQKKYRIILVSGSMDLFVKTVAKRLAITDWFANTTLVFNSEDTLIDFDYTLDQADKKYQQVTKFLKNNNLDFSHCIAIGNGENDLKLFKASSQSFILKTADNQGFRKFATHQISSLRELLEYL